MRVRLPVVGDDFEREVLHVGLPLSVVELATNEVLPVEDGVDSVHRDLVLRNVAGETLVVGEGDIGRDGAVTLVVGDDIDAVVLPGKATTRRPLLRGFEGA